MDKYLIISPHTSEECLRALHETMMQGYLHHFDWACKSGEHTGYITIEADNEKEAIMVVPPFLRHKARALKLSKFSSETVEELVRNHNEKSSQQPIG